MVQTQKESNEGNLLAVFIALLLNVEIDLFTPDSFETLLYKMYIFSKDFHFSEAKRINTQDQALRSILSLDVK